jgi:hypothetical protein
MMSHDMTLAVIITGGILFGLIILVGLPVVLGIRMSGRQRELEHQERMKALELGRPWPGEQPADGESQAVNSPDKGTRIGIWVPLGALGIAFVATTGRADAATNMTHMAVWISSAAVGVVGVICGTILAMRTPPPAAPPPLSRGSFKPPLEEDALDIVSRRG